MSKVSFFKSVVYAVATSGNAMTASASLNIGASASDKCEREFLFSPLLNQSPDDANDLARLLHISNEEKRYIENAEVGSGLLIVSKTVVPFNNDFPKDTELFRLMDTSPNRKS